MGSLPSLRRLLIALPSLLGISVILFTVLALAPGDPFEELAHQPERAARGARSAARAVRPGRPGLAALLPLAGRMLQGDWGFSFVSRIDVDKLIMQRAAGDARRHRRVAGAGAADRAAGGRLCGDASPIRCSTSIASTLAFIGFSLPTFFTGLLFILFFTITLDWLPFVYRADIAATGWRWWWEHIQAGDHAGRRAGAVPGARAGCATCARRCST